MIKVLVLIIYYKSNFVHRLVEGRTSLFMCQLLTAKLLCSTKSLPSSQKSLSETFTTNLFQQVLKSADMLSFSD